MRTRTERGRSKRTNYHPKKTRGTKEKQLWERFWETHKRPGGGQDLFLRGEVCRRARPGTRKEIGTSDGRVGSGLRGVVSRWDPHWTGHARR
jgi:hypothetical protein